MDGSSGTDEPRPAPIPLRDIAARVEGVLEGDGDRTVTSVAPLDEADPASLSWLGDARYASQLSATRAGGVLVKPGCVVPAGLTVIRVADPDLALIGALQMLAPPVDRPGPGVHPSSVVHPTARVENASIGPLCTIGPRAVVGAGTVLHAGVHIGADCRLGRDCELWPNVVVRERCTLGDRVIVHPGAVIGADGFGYLFRGGQYIHVPQIGTVSIEDDVEIGANSTIDRARSGVTRIGRGTKIDNLVQIGHNCDIGEHCVIVAHSAVGGSSTLGDYVVLSALVGVTDHVTIGDGAQVSAMSGVGADVRPGEKVRGVPAFGMTDFARQQILMRRLPQLNEQVRELAKRIERLEATAHDRA